MNEYISREEAIETIRYGVCRGHGNKEQRCELGSCAECGIVEIINDISRIEAADVQPVKHGRWIYDGDCMITSCCNTAYDINKFQNNNGTILVPTICPNCGCKMGR